MKKIGIDLKEIKFKSKIVSDIDPKKEQAGFFNKIKNKLRIGRKNRGG